MFLLFDLYCRYDVWVKLFSFFVFVIDTCFTCVLVAFVTITGMLRKKYCTVFPQTIVINRNLKWYGGGLTVCVENTMTCSGVCTMKYMILYQTCINACVVHEMERIFRHFVFVFFSYVRYPFTKRPFAD